MTKHAPTLKRHKKTGHGYAYFDRRQYWFGDFDDPSTHARFAAFVAQWEANGRVVPNAETLEDVTLSDLVARYLQHAEIYYRRPDGTQTGEAKQIAIAARPLLELYRDLPVAGFDLPKLELVRNRMLTAGLARTTINIRVSRILHMVRWGASKRIVPPTVYPELKTLEPLKRGRSAAAETEPVAPVCWEVVEATLPHLPTPVRAMVLLQWHTGMRPGEVVRMRLCDIQRDGSVWLYRPERHKTEHHGRERVVALGPRAQEALRPILHRVPRPGEEEFLFSPALALAERHAEARRKRSTPLWPSHENANVRKRTQEPRSKPGEKYKVDSYRRAIYRACEMGGVVRWSPNQLRHAAATRIRKALGLEAARVVLGHRSSAVTEIYAEIDRTRALEIMGDLG